MNNEQLQKYNEKRDALIKEYRIKKLKSVAVVLAVALLAIVLDVLLGILVNNIAVALVIGMMIVIFSVIMVRVRIVTANHTLQSRLQYFEQDYE